MFNYKNFTKIALFLALAKNLCAWNANNGSWNTDANFKPTFCSSKALNSDARFNFVSGAVVEFMVNPEGRDARNKKVGVFQIYSPKNSQGEPYESWRVNAGQYSSSLDKSLANQMDALNDGELGLTPGIFSDNALDQVSVKGDCTQNSVTMHSTISTELEELPGTVYVTSYMPFKSISVTNASVTPLGRMSSFDAVDTSVVEFMTDPATVNNIINNGLKLATTPTLTNVKWSDFQIMLGWKNRFVQDNEHLKGVNLDLAVGLVFPISDELKNENIFEVPMGNDGAFAMPIKASIALEVQERFVFAGKLDFNLMFDHNATKRLRKTTDDTELTLDRPVRCKISPGNIFKLQGSATIISPCKCYWARAGYEYGRKTEDKVLTNATAPKLGDAYTGVIVNSAEQFKESDFHNALINAGIDFEGKSERLSPRLQAFARIPLKGKRINLYKSFGFELSLNF